MQKYEFMAEDEEETVKGEEEVQITDRVVIENKNKKGKGFFRFHGLSVAGLLVISFIIIVAGIVIPILLRDNPLFLMSFLVLVTGLLILAIFFKLFHSYLKTPASCVFDGSEGTLRYHFLERYKKRF